MSHETYEVSSCGECPFQAGEEGRNFCCHWGADPYLGIDLAGEPPERCPLRESPVLITLNPMSATRVEREPAPPVHGRTGPRARRVLAFLSEHPGASYGNVLRSAGGGAIGRSTIANLANRGQIERRGDRLSGRWYAVVPTIAVARALAAPTGSAREGEGGEG